MDKLQVSGSQIPQTQEVKQNIELEEKKIETKQVVQKAEIEETPRMTIEEKTSILEQLRQSDISPAVREALIKMLGE